MNLDLLNYLKNKVKNKMSIKYQSINNQYNKEISNQLIYNMRTLIVANYKEFLLFQARTENLKRYYTMKEAFKRLQKLNNFYGKFSKIYPNYMVFNEACYIYKNIKRKQILLDKNNSTLNRNRTGKNIEAPKIFHTQTINSIYTNSIRTINQESNKSLELIIDIIDNAENEILLNDLLSINKVTDSVDKLKINLPSDDKTTIDIMKESIKNEIGPNLKIIKIPVHHMPNNKRDLDALEVQSAEKLKIAKNIRANSEIPESNSIVKKLLEQNLIKKKCPSLSIQKKNHLNVKLQTTNRFFRKYQSQESTPTKSIIAINKTTLSNKLLVNKINVVNIDLNKENINIYKQNTLPNLNMNKIFKKNDKKCLTEKIKTSNKLTKIEEIPRLNLNNQKNGISNRNNDILIENDQLKTSINKLNSNLMGNKVLQTDPSINNKIEPKSKRIKSIISEVTEFYNIFKSSNSVFISKAEKVPLSSRNDNAKTKERNEFLNVKILSINSSRQNVFIINKLDNEKTRKSREEIK